MSDAVKAEDREYVSSKRATQVTGYAQDYIGQLCRSGAVDSKKIGGLWYLTLDSLYKHKQKADSYVPVAPRISGPENPEAIVTLEGKDFVSTPKASEITGYHKDYVGQLAREGTIPSRQIGARWYVNRSSIVAHKREKDSLLAAVQTESVGLLREKDPALKNTESLANASISGANGSMAYVSENADLYPTIEAKRRIAESPVISAIEGVENADASNIREYVGWAGSQVDLGEAGSNRIPIRVWTGPAYGSENPIRDRRDRSGRRYRMIGMLAGTVAAAAVFIFFGISLFGSGAMHIQNPAVSRDALPAQVSAVLGLGEDIGDVIERMVTDEIVYRRPFRINSLP